METLKTAVEYKEHWGRVLAERARSGATGPEPVPHPDDIIIDSETGEVRFDGPVLEEQKAAQKSLRASKVALEGPVTKSADLEHIIVNSYPLQLVTGGRNGRLWRTGVIQGPRATVGFLPKAVIR